MARVRVAFPPRLADRYMTFMRMPKRRGGTVTDQKTVEDVLARLDSIEQRLAETKRSVDSVRTMAFLFAVLFVGIPGVLMLLNLIGGA